MSEQEIIEGNKLIAYFMGYNYIPFDETKPKNSPVGWWKDNRIGIVNKIEKNYLCRKHIDLKYHLSWDWLMPVVEKIITTKIPSMEKDGELYGRRLRFNTYRTCVYNSDIIQIKVRLESDFKDLSFGHNSYSEIESTFRVIIEFIKWYNLCQKEKEK